MRTKSLLLSAVLGVMGVATSLAQVYSVNVVGYINLTIPSGFSMIANQLKNSAGNTVGVLMPTAPDGTTIYKYNNTSGAYSINTYEFGAWANAGETLNPGEGAFISVPTGQTLAVTLVGDVPTGALTQSVPAGFSIQSSQVPQSAQLDTVLGFPVAEGDTVYFFNNATGAYSIATYEFGAWSVPPVPKVGESFFVKKGTAATWNRTFTVN